MAIKSVADEGIEKGQTMVTFHDPESGGWRSVVLRPEHVLNLLKDEEIVEIEDHR